MKLVGMFFRFAFGCGEVEDSAGEIVQAPLPSAQPPLVPLPAREFESAGRCLARTGYVA